MSRLTVCLAFLLVSAVAAAAEPAPPSHPSTIEVTTRGSVAVTPDRALLDLGVTTDKKTATAAIAENDRKMEQVIAALKKEVGADGEVKTAEFNVTPRFGESRRGEAAPIMGYTVTNTVHVRMADTKAVGRLLDRAFQAGANTVQRLEFTVKDPEAAQNAALRAASAKARARATAIADGLGVRVGQVVSVSEPRSADHSFGAGLYNLRSVDKSVPIEAGSVEVGATVVVVFAVAAR
jgi:uncharacterized protein YggE